MTERGLHLSEIEGWKTEYLELADDSLGRLITTIEGLLQSMLIEQDDLAESWNGAGAAAAADRVASEHTAGSHISAKIGEIKGYFTSGKKELDDAKNFVLTKRNNFIAWGFEVDDRGIVSAVEKVRQLHQAGQDRPDVLAAGFALMAEAGRHTTELLQALQHAEGVAMRVEASISTASSELTDLVLREAPSEAARVFGLVPGLPQESELPDGLSVAEIWRKLESGIPVTYTDAEGKTVAITPNPDGTQTVAASVTALDGTTTTTTSTNNGPATTTVSQPRPDSSGIVDTTITGPDGKRQQLQTVPSDNGRSTTYAVNEDGSLGSKVSESYPAPNGGVVTDVTNPDGSLDREWRGEDGFRAYERFMPGPDGQPQLVATSNSAGMRSELQVDGAIQTTYPGGHTATTAQLPDGRVVTQFDDGSVLAYDPEAAAEGVPEQSAWKVVKSWTGTHWEGFISSTEGTVGSHPIGTGASLGAAAAAEAATQGVGTMAERAAAAAGQSAQMSARAVEMLDSGTPGAGRVLIESIDSAGDAAKASTYADALKTAGKYGGPAATIGINSFVNFDDWKHHDKPGDEAIANAVGGSVGGIAGGLAGAKAGALLCGMFTANPVAAAACAVGGGIVGGFGLGSAGAYVAEQPFK